MSNRRGAWGLNGESAKAPFRYTGCGLDDIWLISGYTVEEHDGEQAVTIRNLEGLHKAIGESLIQRKKILSSKEVRFLRRQIGITQSEMARLVGCDAQQIARYEKGENKMPGPTDRLVRMLYKEHIGGDVPVRAILKALDELDSRMNDRHTFKETLEGWREAA